MRKRDREAERRKRVYDEAIAEAKATLAEMRAGEARSAASTPLATDRGSLGAPRAGVGEGGGGGVGAGAGGVEPSSQSVEELVAREVERQRRAEREAANAAEVERFRCPVGRGCWRCGLVYSFADPVEDAWNVTSEGAECVWCHNERVMHDPWDTTADGRRVRAIGRLLGLSGQPMRAYAEPSAFRGIRVWFSEHPDAEPVVDVDRRFAHVDLDRVRREWDLVVSGRDVPEPEPEIMSGDRCEVCGGRDRFVSHVQKFPGHAWLNDTEQRPDGCVDCTITWLAQATGRVPDWWVERKGRRLPEWAKQLVEEAVPA